MGKRSVSMRKRSYKSGAPPGSIVHVGKRYSGKTAISVMDISSEKVRDRKVADVKDCAPPRKKSRTISWIDISGLHDVLLIEEFGKQFSLHPLLLEDVVNTSQRPKVEDYGTYLFFTLKMLSIQKSHGTIACEQVSVVLGDRFVISFQERPGDIFDPVRDRIRKNSEAVCVRGADYLMYTLIDIIVDNYFHVIEYIGEEIEQLENRVIRSSREDILVDIQRMKRNVLLLRRTIAPLREAVSRLEKTESPLLGEHIQHYFRDVYDHIIYVTETLETYREVLTGITEVHLSSLSKRMNEIMKVLTVIATIFIPLTFITGVYGMNFQYFPELGWRYGYAAVWIAMLVIAGGMLLYFKKRKWL